MSVIFTLFLIIYLFAKPAFAQGQSVLINEFYALGGSAQDPDWIELYNSSDNSVVLDGWVVRDDTESNKILLSGSICPQSFRKFDFSNRLNKGGDKIRLFNSESSTAPLEEITYFSDNIPSHLENQSTSRNPDGQESWIVSANPTPSNDDSCTPKPTPTPTPEPSPKTSKSSPSSTTKSPSPIPLNSPQSSVKQTKTQSPSAKPAPILGKQKKITIQKPTEEPSPSEILSATSSGEPQSKTQIAAIISGSGAILIGLSIGLYLWYKRGSEKSKSG